MVYFSFSLSFFYCTPTWRDVNMEEGGVNGQREEKKGGASGAC